MRINQQYQPNAVQRSVSPSTLCDICNYEGFREMHQGKTYQYSWKLGPVVPPHVTPETAMAALQREPNSVFPFEVRGTQDETAIILGARYSLVGAIPGAEDPVVVVQQGPTHFAFETEAGHFRGEGQIVGFITYAKDGDLYLQQVGTSSGSALDPLYDKGARWSWEVQAKNLRGLVYGNGRYEAFPPTWLRPTRP